MTKETFINILVAEDNDISREMMSEILRTQGYRVYGAVDGESAIKVVEDRDVDLALVDINMAPKGGLDFIKYLIAKGIDLPVVVVTAVESSHALMEASSLGAVKIIQKPIDPEKLLQIVHRILARRGLSVRALTAVTHHTTFSPEDLMKKAIALAEKNARSQHGGPFGAIVADGTGKVLGEGVNGSASRADPTAHAEVMAIRRAADKLGRSDLSDCVLYCSSEPTAVGQALVASVGIKKVYYGLSGEEIRSFRKPQPTSKAEYISLGHDEALAMFKEAQARREKGGG